MDRLDTRMGALALGASAIALAAFPLMRPFFPLDVFSTSILTVAARPVASAAWVGSHAIATIGFVSLVHGLLALYGRLAGTAHEPMARSGLGFALVGIGLVLPALGVETYALPVIGSAYLAGHTGVEAVVAPIYRGPMTLVMLLGLVLLAPRTRHRRPATAATIPLTAPGRVAQGAGPREQAEVGPPRPERSDSCVRASG